MPCARSAHRLGRAPIRSIRRRIAFTRTVELARLNGFVR
jgi:hypothetical protein